MSLVNPSSSSNNSNEAAVKEVDSQEPESKKIKLSQSTKDNPVADTLEQRLGGILCCAVCLDLPKSAVYQCPNGHLMCAGCFTHLLADARLRAELSTCPNCRTVIDSTSASRNLAVEKAVSELPAQCRYCSQEYPRNSLERHEEAQCNERISVCRYSRIGCSWKGPFHELSEHEKECSYPHHTGDQIIEVLESMEQSRKHEKHLYDSIFDLLSFEEIGLKDLQMKPDRTDEFIPKLYYETSRFGAFNNQWVVKARINNSQRDPALSCEREMSYQIILKTKTELPLSIHYMVLRGPFSDIKVNAKIYKFTFTEQENESPYVTLPLPDSIECNRLLAAKAINFRDWWDDFDRERPSRLLDQHFGLGLKKDDLFNNWSSLSTPLIRPGRYFRPWNESLMRSNSGSSNIKTDEKQFQVILDVQQFAPNEITVKVSDGSIVVEGKHDEKQDEHGFISRHFIRRYVPPKEVDLDNVVSSLSSDGVLTVSIPKKAEPTGERLVHVIQTGIPAVKSGETPIKTTQSTTPNETHIKIEQEGK